MQVETGQTPEERAVVIKVTTHHGIGHQNNSLLCWILSNPPEIMHLNEASVRYIVDIISKREVLYNNCWMYEITKYSYKEVGF